MRVTLTFRVVSWIEDGKLTVVSENKRSTNMLSPLNEKITFGKRSIFAVFTFFNQCKCKTIHFGFDNYEIGKFNEITFNQGLKNGEKWRGVAPSEFSRNNRSLRNFNSDGEMLIIQSLPRIIPIKFRWNIFLKIVNFL